MKQIVGVVFNPDKPLAQVEAERLKRWLKKHQVEVLLNSRVTSSMQRAGFVVALGGDGTVLRVARAVSGWNVPVLGVNVGRLGFLAATEVGAMVRTLSRVLAGQGRVEHRTLLTVTATVSGKKSEPLAALNDAVVRSRLTGRVVVLRALLRGRLLASYAGDGLIVSTPTGSTAYSLAASGPIIHPELDVLLLTPICPHTLAQRPLVLPPFEKIVVEIGPPADAAVLCLDGQITLDLKPGDQVEVARAVERVSLLMDPGRSFYQVLQTKLKWGGP